MTYQYITEGPPGHRDAEASAIRAPTISSALAIPSMRLVNWLLAQGASVIAECYYPSSGVDIMQTSRIYHRRSVNANRVAVFALIEDCSLDQSPSFTFVISNGSTLTQVMDGSTTATTPFGSPSWRSVFLEGDLVDSGLQYHTIAWNRMIVRCFIVFEIARDRLDSSSDTMVVERGGSYAGLISGRYIDSSGSNGGITDLLNGVNSARVATKRHGSLWLYDQNNPWSTTTQTPSWGNLADSDLGTSGFGFETIARSVKDPSSSPDDVVSNAVYICAKYTNSGDIKISSDSDSVSFTALTGSWAYHTPDGGNTLDIAADANDTIVPEGQVDNSGTDEVFIRSIQWLE